MNLAPFSAFTAASARAGNDDEIPIGSEASMTGAAVAATVQDGAAGYYNPAGLANSTRPTLDVAADLDEPRTLRLGVAYRLARGWLSVDGDVATPLVVECAEDRDWNYNVRAGGVLPLSDNIEVGAGVFTDRSPQRSTPVDFYGGTMGVRVGQDHAVDGARQLTFATTLAGRYAYGTGEMQGASVPTEDVDDWGPTGVRALPRA